MEFSETSVNNNTTTTTTTNSSTISSPRSLSPTSSSSPPPPPPNNGGSTTTVSATTPTTSPTAAPIIISPCAACKILRRRCAEKCVLAPYFPPTEPAKFTIAHRVFGASNIIKLLQDLPESQRTDAVSSMVYEAGARIRDPVYGCAGAICQLQKQISELQAQLAKAQAEILSMQTQQANLVALLCMEMAQSSSPSPLPTAQQQFVDNFMAAASPNTYQINSSSNNSTNLFMDDANLVGSTMWEPLLWA